MRFLKVYVSQHRTLLIEKLREAFGDPGFESFRDWFHEETSFVRSKMSVKKIGVKEIFSKKGKSSM